VEHEAIVASAIAAIRPRLRGTDARVVGSNLYLQAGDLCALPDLAVFCGPSAVERRGGAPDRLTRPALLVEVGSPTTLARDTGAKAAAYLGLPGLRAYLVVHSDRRLVEVWRPGTAAAERITRGEVPLHAEGLAVDLDEPYDQVEL
jgi:Uma2 family endonuclease